MKYWEGIIKHQNIIIGGFFFIIVIVAILFSRFSCPKVCFKLTTSSFQQLEQDGVPKTVLQDLQSLQDQELCNETWFLRHVQDKIGEKQMVKYKERILIHARLLPQSPPTLDVLKPTAELTISPSPIPREIPHGAKIRTLEGGDYILQATLQLSDGSSKLIKDMVIVRYQNDELKIINPNLPVYPIVGELKRDTFRGTLNDAGATIHFNGTMTPENKLEGSLTGRFKYSNMTLTGSFSLISTWDE